MCSAAGNSGGDREMLEYVQRGPHPAFSLLVNHDDGDREYAYESRAGTFTETEAIVDVGKRLGWTIASMRDGWSQVFREGVAGGRV